MSNKKTILITGSSSGIGRAAAEFFAERGWNVVATMRNPDEETELGRIDGITIDALDVTNPEQVHAAAEKFGEVTDVVLNNAGYGLVGPLEGITDEQMLREFDTNFMGTVRTTRAFLPYFREKRAGLFINTVSIGGVIALPFSSSYFATKWAMQGWSEVMSFELEPFGVGVKTVLPGPVDTNFYNAQIIGHHPAYKEHADPVLSRLTDPEVKATYSQPELVAEVIYSAATDGKDKLIYLAGSEAESMYALRRDIGDEAFRHQSRQKFFASANIG